MKTNWQAIRIGCLILVSGGISSPLLAQMQDANGAASVISSVAITQASEHSSVRVEGDGPLAVRAARMQDPDRLVLDFDRARLAVRFHSCGRTACWCCGPFASDIRRLGDDMDLSMHSIL